MKTSVILIREWEQQMSGSGCCGRLEGDVMGSGGNRVFAGRRTIMEAMGPLYRGIRDVYGDAVDMIVVDPRNQISLLPRLFRDFVRYRVGWRDALRTLSGITTATVVINGRLFSRNGWPDPSSAMRHLQNLQTPVDGESRAVG